MERKLLTELGRIAAVALTALAVLSCNLTKKNTFKLPESGNWYDTEISGEHYLVFLGSANKDGARGHFYAFEEGPVAPRHDFNASVSKKSVTVNYGKESMKLEAGDVKFRPFTQAEYHEQDGRPFRELFSEVSVTEDIVFGNVEGYWTSLPGVEAEVSKAFTSGYVKSFKHRDLELTLDLYQPSLPTGPKPLILFLHGGAFYVGDKQEPAYRDFCKHFASMGYVTASMNYRMGFHVGKGEIERAGYVALQDAHAAMRFLVSHAAEYGIDPARLFVAGSSAGSITALNLAFMTEKDRPKSSHGGKGFFNGDDLGPIDGSGNDIKVAFKIKAVANMWGAVSSTSILSNSRTGIVSFYGDQDTVVPFAEGYPFSSAGEVISKMLSEKMYGSICIDSVARGKGLHSRIYAFPGEGHALNTTGTEKQVNSNHFFIRDKIADFFFDEMVSQKAAITDMGDGIYKVTGNIADISWKAEGGFILTASGDKVKVLWQEDARTRHLYASGTYKSTDIGWEVSL